MLPVRGEGRAKSRRGMVMSFKPGNSPAGSSVNTLLIAAEPVLESVVDFPVEIKSQIR
jgi:hypothetical protein